MGFPSRNIGGSVGSWVKRWKEKLVMMEDAWRVHPCGWEYPTLKSVSELQKLFEIIGLVIVKSTFTFTGF